MANSKDGKKKDGRVLITEEATLSAFGISSPAKPVEEKN